MKLNQNLSRREFLHLSMLALGAVAAAPYSRTLPQTATDWPLNQQLGRVGLGKVSVRSKPYADATVVKDIYDDAIVVCQQEVVGGSPGYGSRRWMETPDGYIYSPRLQMVRYEPNKPLETLPEHDGERGMWAEVTVPYVDLYIANPPIRTPSLKEKEFPRFYYSQVTWIDDIKIGSSGQPLYRINQKFGTYGDLFWADAAGFKPVTLEDVAPLSPEVEEKKVVVNVTRQTMTCFEGKREVRFCRVSTGAKFDADGNAVDKWSTPLGPHPIYRKLMSLHMSGQKTGDYPAVPWTCLITGDGVAVHSSYWHSDFGVPRSHGCVNAAPEDARFVFRWTNPVVPYYPGDLDVSKNWPPTGTIVEVVE